MEGPYSGGEYDDSEGKIKNKFFSGKYLIYCYVNGSVFRRMKKIMKKVLIGLFLLVLAGCGTSGSQEGIEDYNNTLISIQERSVEALKNYYDGLEDQYNGSNLFELFTGALENIQNLKKEAEGISGWKDDTELRDAVVEYISGMESAFLSYELPVVKILVDYTGQVSGLYKDNENIFSQSAMKLAGELVILDKSLETSYNHFAQKYGYRE